MFLKRVTSEGLAHFSYILGDGGRAAVIDPRRDVEVYLRISDSRGCRITHIFETHRPEDYVSGARALGELTGAEIVHGRRLPFAYGTEVSEGASFRFGEFSLTVLETPGHTFESISLVLGAGPMASAPLAVFTGDALFAGETGRTDLAPGREREAANLLYGSIFRKILPLGDGVILFPGHGAGSLCGEAIAEREFSTLGFERRSNPALARRSRAAFVRRKLRERHYLPPYFRRMEKTNLRGAPLLPRLPRPEPWGVDRFAGEGTPRRDDPVILDARSPEAFAGAHIPGSLSVPLSLIPSFAGWFLPPRKAVGLVAETPEAIAAAVRGLSRLGYDRVEGFLAGGMGEWAASGRPFDRVPTVTAAEVVRRIGAGEALTLLDVRTRSEFAAGHLPGAVHLFLGELPGALSRIPPARPIVTFCDTGLRSIVAASILKSRGIPEVEECLGSFSACAAIGCPLVKGEEA